MSVNKVPPWMADLEEEDLVFIQRFLLNSGSLKETAKLYNVSYPTLRLRLDRLIQKIQISEQQQPEPFVAFIQKLVLTYKMDVETGRAVIREYLQSREEK
ncbi:MAG: DUF2089 domain-containing protein [Clostridiaceae bacterium]|jgi:hypothetical protein|nr:DUF2089 domain-containing protein [Clostridiaceae bacterium]